jgi:Virulence factor
MAQLIRIWWRDIPMQVIAREGRQTEKRVLDKRFQFAVDKAAMNAGKKSYGDYIEEMRRDELPIEVGDGLAAAADAEVARIDSVYTKQKLHALIASGGEGERL